MSLAAEMALRNSTFARRPVAAPLALAMQVFRLRFFCRGALSRAHWIRAEENVIRR